MKRTPYDRLPLLPPIVADGVMERPYTGRELSGGSSRHAEVEAKRQEMTPEQQNEFRELCDQWCRDAYAVNAKWFNDCLKGNTGRDQLYIWVTHWLAAYLLNPDLFRRSCGVVTPTAVK